MKKNILLGVNIDHVATVRQARGVDYPDPLAAAIIAEQAGANGITMHLREDRRHIQDHDVFAVKQNVNIPLNFEMAATDEMQQIALKLKPHSCCIVPEKREELTTEGGLDVVNQSVQIKKLCHCLTAENIEVSLFIDPEENQINAAKECGASTIEIHTGEYANAKDQQSQQQQLQRIHRAAHYAHSLGLTVNAGHGLTLENVDAIAAIPEIHELNIGHSIIARAILIGLADAVREMKKVMDMSRKKNSIINTET